MTAILLVLTMPIGLWLVQSVLLWSGHERPRWRLMTDALSARQKRVMRIATNVFFAGILIAYPLCRSSAVLDHYGAFFPLDRMGLLVGGAAASVLYLTLLYLVWTASDQVHFRVRHTTRRLARRLVGVPLTAVAVTLVEELFFRAVLQHDIQRQFGAPVGIFLGTLVFAGAHYVRKVKRYWTLGGHLALGLLLSVAFWRTGSLWLSSGLHAGGVLMLMGTRPMIRYQGPPALLGASIFPYAGIVGFVALLLLTLNVLLWNLTP